MTHQANGFAKGLTDFTDQRQAQLVHVAEVAIKAGRHNAGGFSDFTQAKAAKAAARFHQVAGGIHQRKAGLLFLFGARQHRGWHSRQVQRRTLANRL